MPCPKTNPRYPDTARSLERPVDVLIRKLDPEFDKERRFDDAYRFGRHRRFREDAVLHGAYLPIAGLDFTADLGSNMGAQAILTSLRQDADYGIRSGLAMPDLGPDMSMDMAVPGQLSYRDLVLQAIHEQELVDNGFCDPVDNGRVVTGTGAGGRNPGTVPSIADENADLSADFNSPNGVGAVFYGGGAGYVPVQGAFNQDISSDAAMARANPGNIAPYNPDVVLQGSDTQFDGGEFGGEFSDAPILPPGLASD